MSKSLRTLAPLLPHEVIGRGCHAALLTYFPRYAITHLHDRSSVRSRSYATAQQTNSKSSGRRQVTIASDDGRINWSDLSTREKAARTTQQTFNLGVIIVGVVMTLGITYFLFTEVILPTSKTSHFNTATTKLKAHRPLTALLGPSSSLSFHGRTTWNRWNRNRPISASRYTDRAGMEHELLQFYVEGREGKGSVYAHLTKGKGVGEGWEWLELYVDVEGGERVWVEGGEKLTDKRAGKMFGIRWW